MLAFTVKYGTGRLYLNNCGHGLESFLYLKLFNTMIVIDFSICRHWYYSSTVLSMLAFTGKYGTGCLYLNTCIHSLESLLYLKLYNTMILVNAGMGNKYSTFRVRYSPCWHLLANMGLMI